MSVCCGLDLGTQRTGFTVGDGAAVPHCSAWRFNFEPDDLGGLGAALWHGLAGLHRDNGLTHLLYEAPLLDRYRDKVATVRRLFGMGFLVETFCDLHGIVCAEEPWGSVKRELTGRRSAEKGDMVAVARRLGVHLPGTKADGMEDAADSLACWLIAVRHFAKQHSPKWDAAIWSHRPFRP